MRRSALPCLPLGRKTRGPQPRLLLFAARLAFIPPRPKAVQAGALPGPQGRAPWPAGGG